MPKHITVVLANQAGALADVLDALARSNVNVWAFHVANTGRNGFVQMICLPHETAINVLRQTYGYYATEGEIIAIRLPHRPGELLRVMKVLADQRINISHAYNTFDRGQPLVILDLEVPWEIETVRNLLRTHKIKLVDVIGLLDDEAKH